MIIKLERQIKAMINRCIFKGDEVWIHVNGNSFWVIENTTNLYTYGYIENNTVKYKTLQINHNQVSTLDRENFECKCILV